MNSDQSFNSLIEQYSFAIADAFIQSVSPSDQASLIAFLTSIEPAAPNPDRPVVYSRNRVTPPPADTPLTRLKQQWQEALVAPPINRMSTKSTQATLRQSLVLNERQIDTTFMLIQRMEGLVERARITIRDPFSQDRLVNHYQGIQATYVTRLARLEAFQTVGFRLLNRC